MSILSRILTAFGVVLMVFLAQGIVAASKLSSVVKLVKVAITDPITEVDAARSAWDVFRQAHDYLEATTQAIRYQDSRAAIAQFLSSADSVVARLHEVDAIESADRSTALVKEVSDLVARWRSNALILLGERPATAIPAPYVMSQLEDRIRADLNENRCTCAGVSGADPWARPSRSRGYATAGERFAGGRNDRGTWSGHSVGPVGHQADGAHRSGHAAAV